VTVCFEWRDAPLGDFAVVGDPVAHSLSPRMQTAAFAALGLNFTYRAIRIRAGEVATALDHLRTLGYRGLNVTVPHKAEARDAMRNVDEFAARSDSVNTIRLSDMAGISTDGFGFVDTIVGRVSKSAPILILGAGGSARAIALALTMDGYNLSISNRTPARAHDLVHGLKIDIPVVENARVGDYALVVNATSASLRGESPVGFGALAQGVMESWSDGGMQDSETADPNAQRLTPNASVPPSVPLAYDLVYGDTPFLAAARSAGWEVMDGKPLLVAQGARSLEFWLPEITAPREVMLEAIL